VPLIRKEPPGALAQNVPSTDLLVRGTPDERWSAARAMGADAAGVAALASALLGESDARVREAILTSLARSATPAAVDALLPHLRSDDAGLRTGALDALQAMRLAVAPRLGELLHDPDSDVRLLACDLVRNVPAAEASSLLAGILHNEPEPNVCAAAVDVLAEVGGPADLPALSACAERFPNETFLRFCIEATVQRISAEGPQPRG
jgi:HEAT repeat protein